MAVSTHEMIYAMATVSCPRNSRPPFWKRRVFSLGNSAAIAFAKNWVWYLTKSS